MPLRIGKSIIKSIGLMQAVVVLIFSLAIGLTLSGIQLRYHLVQQRHAAAELVQDLLTSAQGGATNAAWTLDRRLAGQVVANVLAIGGVGVAEIRDDRANVLARSANAAPAHGWFLSWMTDTIIGTAPQGERTLRVTDRGQLQLVGTLSIGLSEFYVADEFLGFAVASIAFTFLSAFLIGAVLLWVSYRLVTMPLRRAATEIAAIDPESPSSTFLPIPALHRENELGRLISHTNDMLGRLQTSRDALAHAATRDSLTGLPNRRVIRERLENALSRAQREKRLVGVLFVDLDRFKNVNDLLGHEIGDELLKSVANTLAEAVRSTDTVGRLGGDEFLIILDGIQHLDEVVLAVRRIVESLSAIRTLRGHEVQTGASIGIAMYPGDGEDAVTLMRHADLAMYQAKGAEATPWYFFSNEMSERVESRLSLEARLAVALSKKEFHLFLQPKFHAKTGTLAGCEALLRWRYAGRWISPEDFISILEEIGKIHEIGEWVIGEVCELIRRWGSRRIPVAVNVSARQLTDSLVVETLLHHVERCGIEAGLLELEITETALMENLDRSHGLLRRFRDEGVKISIDDFGMGYSSLAYLSRLPVNALKLDRSFVSGSRRSRVLLSTIIAMAKALGLQTVAEGVETEEQCAEVVGEGCDQVQGYLLGRPVSIEEFESTYLNTNIKSHAAG